MNAIFAFKLKTWWENHKKF